MAKTTTPTAQDFRSMMAQAVRRASIFPSIEGYKPQDHQIDFHKSTALIKLFLGGNRVGKTVAGGADLVWKATGRHPYNQIHKPPLRCRAIGVDFEDGIKRIILPEIARWIPPSELKNGSWEDSYSAGGKTLTLNNGSFIEFMSYDQDVQKFAGTSRHAIWCDEEPPQEIFNENLLRLLDANGQMALTMTPLIDMSWTYDRLYIPGTKGGKLELPDGQEFGYIDVFTASTFQNAYIPAAMISIITEGMSEEEKMARTDGQYFSYTGTIYANAIQPGTFVNSLMGTDTFDQMVRKGWEFFGFLDHGYRNPTAYYLAAADVNGRIVVLDEVYQANKLIRENSFDILALNEKWGLEKKLNYIVADPAIVQRNGITGTSSQTEYAEQGVYLSIGNNDVQAGIQRTSKLFKTGKLNITTDCEKLQWELSRYRWAKYDTSKARDKNNQKEEPLKKDDHACDALRYGVMSRPQANEEVAIHYGNINRAPTVATDYDEELREVNQEKSYYDPELGTDW
jgi:phage terminase large subunit-like protein